MTGIVLLCGVGLLLEGAGALYLLWAVRQEVKALRLGHDPVKLWESWKSWYEGPADVRQGRNRI